MYIRFGVTNVGEAIPQQAAPFPRQETMNCVRVEKFN